jgi:hypothetical protein
MHAVPLKRRSQDLHETPAFFSQTRMQIKRFRSRCGVAHTHPQRRGEQRKPIITIDMETRFAKPSVHVSRGSTARRVRVAE